MASQVVEVRGVAAYFFDRSRHEDYEHCPRHRYEGFERENGPDEPRGLEPEEKSMPLITGDTVHKGIEFFLNGYGEDAAVASAMAHYEAYINAHGFEKDDLTKDQTVAFDVQAALCEALIRGWIRYLYPKFSAEYEVLELEHEEVREFPNPYGPDYPPLRLMARTDCIVERKKDKRRFIHNWKTAKKNDDRKKEEFVYDAQTISEVLAAEPRVGKIDGVVYTLLNKGTRSVEWPYKSGNKHNASPLIWCWIKEGQTGVEDTEYATRYEYVGENGKNHKLGKGWKRELVTKAFPEGVMGWMKYLEEFDPELLEGQFTMLNPIMRTEWDVAEWMEGTLFEEAAIAEAAEFVRQLKRDNDPRFLTALRQLFPKHTVGGNCLWWTRCPFFNICWGTAGDDPLESGYQVREPNHPEPKLVTIDLTKGNSNGADTGSGNQVN